MRKLTTILMVVIVSAAVTMLLTGCKDKPAEPVPTAMQDHQGHEHDMDMTDAASGEGVQTEQTTCPVMGAKINKDIFVEYEGKKVYFCCPGCEETFLKDTEKYIGKLPQFQE